MPIHVEYEADFARVRVREPSELGELREATQKIVERYGAKEPICILVLNEDIEYTRRSEFVRAASLSVGELLSERQVRIAVHAGSEYVYGLTRMFGAFLEGPEVAFEVFRDREEAECWLLGKPYPPEDRLRRSP